MNFFFIELLTFNLIFIIYYMYKYFKINFYNYQKLSLYFIIITNTILLIINTIIPQKRVNNKNEFDLYKDDLGNAALCIPFLIIFILLSYIISYARVKIKLLTHIDFISNYTIIIFIGICGIILTIIEIIFSQIFQCNIDEMNNAFKTLCNVTDTNNEIYHDNIKTFFVKFGDLSGSDLFINIILILFYPILSFLEILCELSIIYYLNPIYILIREHIYYFCLRITFVSLNDNTADYITPRFFILESADILALIGYCIYLQLIELKFCKLDKDLDKNIIQRGELESIIIPMKTILVNELDVNDDVTDDRTLSNITKDDISTTIGK